MTANSQICESLPNYNEQNINNLHFGLGGEGAEEYKFTKCGKCFNTKRGTELRKVMQGGSIGYNVRGKFITLKTLRLRMVKISNVDSPF
jgi:hypothetical protein